MECSICFLKVVKFKVLKCGHYYCEQCVGKLVAKHTSRNDETSEHQEEVVSSDKNVDPSPGADGTEPGIPCPKCREPSPIPKQGSKGLKSKFCNNMACIQCDKEKRIEEFRWCHECLISVCSSCYLDKHMGSGKEDKVHRVSKWEEYKGVEFCLSQLKLEVKRTNDVVADKRQQLHRYLDALREVLDRDIGETARKYTEDVEKGGRRLAEEFGIDWEAIPTAENKNTRYQYVLPQLRKLTALDHTEMALDTIEKGWELNVHHIPFNEISRHLFSTQQKPFQPKIIVPKAFKKSCEESVIIGANKIENRISICLLNSNELVISDWGEGLFVFTIATGILAGPFKKGFQRTSVMCKVPGQKRQVMAEVQKDQGNWCCHILSVPLDPVGEELNTIAVGDWPDPESLFWLSSSQSTIFFFTKNGLWKYTGLDESNKICLHQSCKFKSNEKYDRIGPILETAECSQVFLVSEMWESVDIVSVGSGDNNVCGVRRIKISTYKSPRFTQPLIGLISWEGPEFLLSDRVEPGLYCWNLKNQSVAKLGKFDAELPFKMVLSPSDRTLFVAVLDRKNWVHKCIEMIEY